MFNNNIGVESIPEYVYELCKLVARGINSEKELRDKMEPKELNVSEAKRFGLIRDAAIELKTIKKVNEEIELIVDKNCLKNLDSFRRYCNSVAWKNTDMYFCKISRCFLESNESWLKYGNLIDQNIIREIHDKTGIDNVQPAYMRGIRLWISFLGFGYIQEKGSMCYLPNMYIALKDLLVLGGAEKGKEYTIAEFLDIISRNCSIAVEGALQDKKINLALSNALRQMHDNKEIELKHNLDSESVWHLFSNNAHQFSSDITHIVYKGVKA